MTPNQDLTDLTSNKTNIIKQLFCGRKIIVLWPENCTAPRIILFSLLIKIFFRIKGGSGYCATRGQHAHTSLDSQDSLLDEWNTNLHAIGRSPNRATLCSATDDPNSEGGLNTWMSAKIYRTTLINKNLKWATFSNNGKKEEKLLIWSYSTPVISWGI
jgi:hypothetical protein